MRPFHQTLVIPVALARSNINIRRSMRRVRPIQVLGCVAALFLCASCEEMETAEQAATNAMRAVVAPTQPSGYWNGDDVPGTPRIVVHLSEQKAYFYKGKHLVGESTVSTGKRGFGTPPGHYHVVSKDRDHVSSEFGDYIDDDGNVVKSNIDVRKDSKPRGTHFDGARMPYCMHFNGGYAMHQGYVPPYAASHGCIRVPKGMAEHFFDAAPEGTSITVKE
jgi:lipoprotein-anchoring transpeptidase ErfK/SrfK